MISRSDGETFHLLLADHPVPCPGEASSMGTARQVSACFWYSHVRHPQETLSTVVILSDSRTNHPSVFRRIETAADLLAEELALKGCLAGCYELFEDSSSSDVS